MEVIGKSYVQTEADHQLVCLPSMNAVEDYTFHTRHGL